MLEIKKNPSEYTTKILMFLLSGQELSTRNLMNLNECMHKILTEDQVMLSCDRFKSVMIAMDIAVSDIEMPLNATDRKMRQVVMGNLFFKIDALLSAPQGKDLLHDYRSKLRHVLARLLNHFLDIHCSYVPKDDACLFAVLGKLHTKHDTAFLVDVDLKKLDRFAGRCTPPEGSKAPAPPVKASTSSTFNYHNSIWLREEKMDCHGLQLDRGVASVSIVASQSL